MIDPTEFIQFLVSRDYKLFTGVPCSFFKYTINAAIDNPDAEYVAAANEGAALGIAAGSEITGERSAVMIQNSGLGNLINPLTSLSLIYRIPSLIFISGRAYKVDDEPQHEIIGKKMTQMFDMLEVAWEILPDTLDEAKVSLDKALAYMDEENKPFFFVVPKDRFAEYKLSNGMNNDYQLSRYDVIERLAKTVTQNDIIIGSTGKIGRELFEINDRKQNFYMMGSMGHAVAFGLGISLARGDKRVIILDGDGSTLMHMGSLSTVGSHDNRIVHITLDNEAYETTGGQATTSNNTELDKVASAANYKQVVRISTHGELEAFAQSLADDSLSTPCFALVKINLDKPEVDIPRITTKYDAKSHAANFSQSFN